MPLRQPRFARFSWQSSNGCDRLRSSARDCWAQRDRYDHGLAAQQPVLAGSLLPQDAVLGWLLWYNRKRMHSTLNYVSPVEFEYGRNNALIEAAALNRRRTKQVV